jgi:3-oxoadipate enol-lactonase
VSETRGPSEDVFVEIDGLRIHCRLEGAAGGPWMIFSNSLATDLSVWDEQVEVFAGHYRILRYDQRGHGETEVPAAACTFDQLTEDAAALLDYFGVEAGVFAGVSMGAVTALRLAQRFPNRLRAVIACDGQPASPASAEETWEQRIHVARQSGMDALMESTLERWFSDDFRGRGGPRLDEVRAMIRNTPIDGYIACARALQRYDFRTDLAKIRLPVLLVVGEKDGALPAVMRSLHLTIPGSKFVEIVGAGHLPNIERAADVMRATEIFLDQVGRTQGDDER